MGAIILGAILLDAIVPVDPVFVVRLKFALGISLRNACITSIAISCAHQIRRKVEIAGYAGLQQFYREVTYTQHNVT